MTDIPYLLTTTDMLLLRLGQASYGDQPTRAVALALGYLAQPADLQGTTATICIDAQTVNLCVNAHVADIWSMGGECVPQTMAQTLRALDRLVEMEFIHETARVIGPCRVHLLDCGALVPRIDPVLDFNGPWPDYGIEGPTIGYGQEAA